MAQRVKFTFERYAHWRVVYCLEELANPGSGCQRIRTWEINDAAHTLETDEREHLFLLLLCSSLVEVLVGGEKGNGQLVKREGRKREEKRGQKVH